MAAATALAILTFEYKVTKEKGADYSASSTMPKQQQHAFGRIHPKGANMRQCNTNEIELPILQIDITRSSVFEASEVGDEAGDSNNSSTSNEDGNTMCILCLYTYLHTQIEDNSNRMKCAESR